MNLVFESIAFKLKTNVSVGMVVVAEVAIMGETQAKHNVMFSNVLKLMEQVVLYCYDQLHQFGDIWMLINWEVATG